MAAEKYQGPAMGIDLGTTYSCVGIWRNDQVQIVLNGQGNRTTPSCVAYTATDQLVRDAANNQYHRNPHNTIYGSKWLIGRNYRDVSHELHPLKVVSGPSEKPFIVVQHKGKEKRLFPEDVSAVILSYMRDIASDFLGASVTNAVVTVPAYFNDSQRRATKEAGRMAGLNVMRIVTEPLAAAIAYQLQLEVVSAARTVLVFDLGGGTFDVSVLRVDGSRLEVKDTGGDSHLGGFDFDERMVKFLVSVFERKHKVDMSGNARALMRLRAACERAKRMLSFSTIAEVEIECLHDGIDFEYKFSRAKFEEINMDLFDQCMDTLRACLKDAGLEACEVDEVVLVGGSTRIPMVQQLMQVLFTGKELCKSISPDEAVEHGATVLATSLVGAGNHRVKDLTLLDVLPLSVGVEGIGGGMYVVIPRNTPILFTTIIHSEPLYDNQTEMPFNIYEGERHIAKENNFLGGFILRGLPPNRLREEVEVTLNFEVDVTAEDENSGARNAITVMNNKEKISSQDISRMVAEAGVHKFNDDKGKTHVHNKQEYNGSEIA